MKASGTEAWTTRPVTPTTLPETRVSRAASKAARTLSSLPGVIGGIRLPFDQHLLQQNGGASVQDGGKLAIDPMVLIYQTHICQPQRSIVLDHGLRQRRELTFRGKQFFNTLRVNI